MFTILTSSRTLAASRRSRKPYGAGVMQTQSPSHPIPCERCGEADCANEVECRQRVLDTKAERRFEEAKEENQS